MLRRNVNETRKRDRGREAVQIRDETKHVARVESTQIESRVSGVYGRGDTTDTS